MSITYVMVNYFIENKMRYNICDICGDNFRPRINGIGNLYRRTCSTDCERKLKSGVQSAAWSDARKKYMSELFTGRDTSGWKNCSGEQKPNWSGGHNPKYYRHMAFDVYKMEKVCIIEGCVETKTRNLCVHHKDGNRNNNTRENLEIRCRSHHTGYHSKEGGCGFAMHDYNENIVRIRNSKISIEDLKQMLYSGCSIRSIGRKYRMDGHSIKAIMVENGIVKPKPAVLITADRVSQHISEGKSIRWIIKEYGIKSHSLITDIMKKNNIIKPNPVKQKAARKPEDVGI